MSQIFFDEHTQVVTDALQSTLASTAGVAPDAVTMIEVKYVSEAARRLLADGDGTVSADYAITFSSADEADAAVSNIMDTAAGTAATDFVVAFAQAVNNDASVNLPLDDAELSVAAVEAEVTQSNDGSDGSSDGSDDKDIIVVIVVVFVGVAVLLLVMVVVCVCNPSCSASPKPKQNPVVQGGSTARVTETGGAVTRPALQAASAPAALHGL